MKPTTKIIIFVIVAFVIVIVITAVRSSSVPAGTTPSPTASVSPTASESPRSATYTLADVAKHKTASDCWTAVGGSVYNLTPFVEKHPGGVPNITKVCGVDGTTTFTAQHGSNQNAQAALATLKIGILTQ